LENPHQTPLAQPAPSRYPELDWFDEPGRGWWLGGSFVAVFFWDGQGLETKNLSDGKGPEPKISCRLVTLESK